MFGKTGGTETGITVFAFALNSILNYIKDPVILLVHSMGNWVSCINYYISDEKTRNQIKGFVGIGAPDSYAVCLLDYGKMQGLDDYTNNLSLEKHSERFGIDAHYIALSEAIKNFNYPCLIVHDENDKEMLYDYAVNSSKNIQKRFQAYKIGDKEYPCFHKTSGLGHRRILRDDNVVKLVVDFISNIEI